MDVAQSAVLLMPQLAQDVDTAICSESNQTATRKLCLLVMANMGKSVEMRCVNEKRHSMKFNVYLCDIRAYKDRKRTTHV